MKKLLGLLAIAPLTLSAAACGGDSTPTVVIAVDNRDMGDAIVKAWEAYADKGDIKLEYKFEESDQLAANVVTQQASQSDVLLVIGDQMFGKQTHFKNVQLDANIKAGLNKDFYDGLNTDTHAVYFPLFENTMLFSYSKHAAISYKTQLEGLNEIKSVDAEGNIILEDGKRMTWESIMSLDINAVLDNADEANGKVKTEEVYPIDPGNSYALTQLFTAGGMNFDGTEVKGFDGALELIVEMAGNHATMFRPGDSNSTKKLAAALGWRFDATQVDQGKQLFSSLGTWDGNLKADGIGFLQQPTYNNVSGKAMAGSKGFVVNGYSKVASSAEKVLKWLYTKDTVKTMVDNSAYIPSVSGDVLPTLDAKTKEIVDALVGNTVGEPLTPISEGADKAVINAYYETSPEKYSIALWNYAMGELENDVDVTDVTGAVAKFKEAWNQYKTDNAKA